MPRICSFDGIEIEMYFRDHPPPHIHAFFGEDEALISISDNALLKGSLPANKLRKALAWTLKRQAELLENWSLRELGKPLNTLTP